MPFSTTRPGFLDACLWALVGILTIFSAPLASAQVLTTTGSAARANGGDDTVLLYEDFEDADVGYTPSIPEFSDLGGDFFTRTDGSNISASYEVFGAGGASFFAAQDLDGEGDDPTQWLSFGPVDISGHQNLNLSVRLAEDDASDGNEDWDAGDYFRVYATVIRSGNTLGRGELEILLFAVESSDTGSNNEPRVDTDFDGLGDGAALTPNFADFNIAIPDGDQVYLRFEMNFNSGDEDIAIDDVRLTGYASPVTVNCAVGESLSFLAAPFSTDHTAAGGEMLAGENDGISSVEMSTCSFAIFDPFTELATYVYSPLPSEVIPASSFVIISDDVDLLPDGPAALVLVEGTVALGASVADVLPNLVSGMVYQSDEDVLFIYRSDVPDASGLLAALALLQNPTAGEEGAGRIALSVDVAPNPLRDRTTVSFGVRGSSDVRVSVYDALGREVAVLADSRYGAGRHDVTFDASDLPAGVYVIRADLGTEILTTRVTVAR